MEMLLFIFEFLFIDGPLDLLWILSDRSVITISNNLFASLYRCALLEN